MGTARSHVTGNSSLANFSKQYVGELLNKATFEANETSGDRVHH